MNLTKEIERLENLLKRYEQSIAKGSLSHAAVKAQLKELKGESN